MSGPGEIIKRVTPQPLNPGYRDTRPQPNYGEPVTSPRITPPGNTSPGITSPGIVDAGISYRPPTSAGKAPRTDSPSRVTPTKSAAITPISQIRENNDNNVSVFGGTPPPAGSWRETAGGWLDTAAQPVQRPLNDGDQFTVGPGGAISAALPGGLGAVATIGGAVSRANLNRLHDESLTNEEISYYPRNTVPGTNTPIATSPGFLGGRVVSGNTDLIPREADVNRDGTLNASEIDTFASGSGAGYDAYQSRQQETEAANAEAARQESARLAEAQRRANETGREQSVGTGRAVTDSHGRPVRDSNNQIVTSRRETVRPDNDDGGGGGGGK